ncbi:MULTISPECIES: zinc-binding dehydrogenase [unclassified Rhizobium]|uniref:zinc-binding dehydrogenase n=1 Tax=unclassified Rhizobium TaxID=2613769 RepID=UPI0027D3A688|nr:MULTISPECIES: zinc-binding dehydrogenase [unclassified Rhizobium]MDQ4409187.1 zinc-binding dehydrogenase [Rhizobium sp. AN63]
MVSTDKPGWHERVISAADGHPIGIVLDPVGGETASTAVGLLAQGGSLVSYGDLSGHPISVPALYFSTRDIRMSGVTVGRWAGLPVEVREADLKLALEPRSQQAGAISGGADVRSRGRRQGCRTCRKAR